MGAASELHRRHNESHDASRYRVSARLTAAKGLLASLKPGGVQKKSFEETRANLMTKQCLNLEYPSLQDFEILQTLGTGTFGRVRLVRSRSTGTYLALKAVKKAKVLERKQVAHIVNEKAVLSQVHHPFIISLKSTFQDSQKLYLLLEYVPGGELFKHLRSAGKFSLGQARFYAASIFLVFEKLHQQDYVYRDLKPENIVLAENGYVKLADFGFAKHLKDGQRSYTLCGTPEYIAPEVIQGKGHGKGADWWSYGVVLFELLSGYPPFWDETTYGTYKKIVTRKLRWPSSLHPHAKDLINHLLSVDLTRRLGCMKAGAMGIRDHPFFSGFDWKGLAEQRLAAPVVPLVCGTDDTSNFDQYAESVVDVDEPLPDPAEALQAFKDF